MQEKIPKLISLIFHPLLIPSYLFISVFNMNSYVSLLIPTTAKFLIFSLVFIATFLFPLLIILIMKRRGLIKSLQMESKEERVYPFLLTGIFFFLSYYMLKQIQISEVFHLFLLGITILVFLSLLINFFSKISIHMVGIGGMAGALTGISIRINLDLVLLISFTILLAGFIGFARLKLKSHQPIQIYTGYLLGFLFMAGIYIL